MAAWISLFPIVFGIIFDVSVASGCSEKDRLVRELTKSYMTSVEPESTTIKVGLSFLCSRYDRTTGKLSTNAWEKFTWTDRRLRWEPSDYDGIEVLRIPSKLIWTPDFKLYNSLKATAERDETNAVVFARGEVLWIPPVHYTTLCSSDPAGSGLSCDFLIGPWTYDANMFKLELKGQGHDVSNYFNSTCPLTVQKATSVIRTKYYPCCKEPYDRLEVNLRLRPTM